MSIELRLWGTRWLKYISGPGDQVIDKATCGNPGYMAHLTAADNGPRGNSYRQTGRTDRPMNAANRRSRNYSICIYCSTGHDEPGCGILINHSLTRKLTPLRSFNLPAFRMATQTTTLSAIEPPKGRLSIPDHLLAGLDPEWVELWEKHGSGMTRADELTIEEYRMNPSAYSFTYPVFPG